MCTFPRTSELEHQLLDSEKARQCAETSLAEVRDQLTLRTQQMHLVNVRYYLSFTHYHLSEVT